MAIAQDVNLTDQPAVGSNKWIPLGGDGFTSPQSLYFFDIANTGDASGGNVVIQVFRDQRFENIASFIQVQVAGAATLVRFDVSREDTGRAIHVGSTVIDEAGTFGALLWAPPLIIDAQKWALTLVNTDTEVIRFKGLVYNFDVQASEKVPLSVLVASMPRSPAAL